MSWTTLLSGASNGVGAATNFLQTQTTNVNALTGTVSGYASMANGYINTAESVLSTVGLGGALSSTLGAVLSNGLNLSCWGGSLTPTTARDAINVYYKPYFEYLINKYNTAPLSEKMSAFNEFIKNAYVINYYFKEKKITEAGWSSCAKKAINEVHKPFFAAIQQQADAVLQDLKNQGAVVENRTMRPLTYTIPQGVATNGKAFTFPNAHKNYSVEYPVITKFTVNEPVLTNPENTQIPTPEHTEIFGPKELNEGENSSSDSKPSEDKDKGASPLSMIVGGLIIKSLFFN